MGRISCHIVRVFRSINSSAHTFYRMFLTGIDITLKQFHDTTRICGYIPCPCFTAALSPDTLLSAAGKILHAINETKNLVDAIVNVHSDQLIHRAFEIFPSIQSRRWIRCLITSFRLGFLSNVGRVRPTRRRCCISFLPSHSRISRFC